MEEVKAKLKEELATLEDELHFKLPKEIQKAREFGDLRENAEYKAAMERQSMATGEISQEDSLIIGAFHSGPLSAIRFVGVVGLILYYSLLVYIAIYAARVIRASQNTEFYPLALFVGLASIWEPVQYLFVFGAYDSGLPNSIFVIGMLKMVSNSLQASKVATDRRKSIVERRKRVEEAPRFKQPVGGAQLG